MAFLRIMAPSGMNGGLSWRRQKGGKRYKDLINTRKQSGRGKKIGETRRCRAPSWWPEGIYLLVSLGGHGQVEPVENVMDLLALHLWVDTVGEEPVAGLRHKHGHEWRHARSKPKTKCCAPPSGKLKFCLQAHLGLDLHDSLLGQGAGLSHGDSLSREVCKDFLTMAKKKQKNNNKKKN